MAWRTCLSVARSEEGRSVGYSPAKKCSSSIPMPLWPHHPEGSPPASFASMSAGQGEAVVEVH